MVTKYWLAYYLISFILIALLNLIIFSIIQLNISYLYLLQISLIFVIWYFISPFLMLSLFKIEIADPALYNLVEEVATQFKIKTPKVYILKADFPNALAFGNLFFKGIAFTKTILSFLNQEELKAVTAHEISHLKNHDPEILVLTLIGINDVYALLLVLFPSYLPTIISIYLIGVFPLFFAIHRLIEKKADIAAAKTGHYSLALQTALIKIAYLSDKIPHNILKNLSEFQILLMKYDIMNSYDGIELFRTHPSLSRRLQYLTEYE